MIKADLVDIVARETSHEITSRTSSECSNRFVERRFDGWQENRATWVWCFSGETSEAWNWAESKDAGKKWEIRSW